MLGGTSRCAAGFDALVAQPVSSNTATLNGIVNRMPPIDPSLNSKRYSFYEIIARGQALDRNSVVRMGEPSARNREICRVDLCDVPRSSAPTLMI
jgi:hypothetical protein